MSNFDDVVFQPDKPAAPEHSAEYEYDPEVYKDGKQQERDEVYGLIDNTALSLTAPDKMRQYLDIQSRFDLYRPGNVLLLQAQMPTATRLKTFDDWKAVGGGVCKNQQSISILKSGKQFTRTDGTIGRYTDIKRVFDISQTYGTKSVKPPTHPEGRDLLKALMHKCPVPAEAAADLPEGVGAFYDPGTNKIYVRPGMEAQDIFRCLSAEMAHVSLAQSMGKDYNRDKAGLAAYCASYVLCRQFGVDVSGFKFDNAQQELSGREPKEIRAELSKIREAAGDIGGRMKEAVRQQQRAAKEQEAR